MSNIKKSIIATIIILILVGFVSFTNTTIWKDQLFLYYFGLCFFIAGIFASNSAPICIIFLFSHSCTGLGIMIFSLLMPIYNNPLLHDNPVNIMIYFRIMALIFIVATVLLIAYNVSKGVRKIKYIVYIIEALYIIGVLITAIFPYIVEFIYKL